MKILCLYNNPCAVEMFEALREQGHEIVLMEEKLTAKWCREQQFDLAVSYSYRYILTAELLEALGNRAVNIHNSVLPWNRGADPNIWSIVDRTPRGVTLHYMDAALDKGYIIAQKLLEDTDEETFTSSYNNLDRAAKELLLEMMPLYPYWESMKKQTLGKGSYHSVADGRAIKELIPSYDMKISEFRKIYEKKA